MEHASTEEERDRRLGEAVDAYVEAKQNGQAITPSQWARRFPDIAEELETCLTALAFVQASSLPKPSSSTSNTEGESGAVPPWIAGYEVLEEIARGGMGIVYKAVQLATKRVVAIKLMAEEVCASARGRRRFEREVELAAALDHSGIVRILESGTAAGRVYCAMEFVDGLPLDAYQRIQNAPVAERLRLFVQIAEAVQYAHTRAVVHRDLKPGNILVDKKGHPHILDFGLARPLSMDAHNDAETSLLTEAGQILGTLPYLSPEQAGGAAHQTDVRSDVYALGVVLYQMLTERMPYPTTGPLDEVLYHIRHTLPARPSSYCRELRSDLDAVVLKALEKSPQVRYQSVEAFAEDVRSYLRGEPVEANRSTRFYLFRKAYARHRRQIHVAGAGLGLVLTASVFIAVLYVQVREQRNRLVDELHVTQLRRGLAHLAAGHDSLAETLLWSAYRSNPDRAATWSLISYFTQNPLAGLISNRTWVTATAFSPNGRWLAYGTLAGELVVCQAADFSIEHRSECHAGGVFAMAFSPSSEHLVTGGADGRLYIWEAAAWKRVAELQRHAGRVQDLRFSASGRRLMSAGADGRLMVWEDAAGPAPRGRVLLDENDPLTCADMAPGGDRLAAVTASQGLRLLNEEPKSGVRSQESGAESRASGAGRPYSVSCLLSPDFSAKPAEAVRFSSDGRRLAVWAGAEVSIWDVETAARIWSGDAGLAEPRPTSLWDLPPESPRGTRRSPPRGQHTCWRPTLAFSPDGSLLVCTGWDAIVRLWESATGRYLGALRSHGAAVYAAAFAPKGRRLAVGLVGSMRVWDVDRTPGVLSWPRPPEAERVCVAISQKAGVFAWGGMLDGTVNVVSLADPSRLNTWKASSAPVHAVAFSPDGRTLLTADRNGLLRLWRVEQGAGNRDQESGVRSQESAAGILSPVSCLLSPSFSLSSEWNGQSVGVWSVAFSPDGQLLAGGGRDGKLRVWRCSDSSVFQTWTAHLDQILNVAFSPDGNHVLSGGTDWMVKLWRLGETSPVNEWSHKEWVNAVAFSSDGRMVASSGADLTTCIRRLDGAEVAQIYPAHAHWTTGLAFLDHDRVLVSGGYDGALRFLDPMSGAELAMTPSVGGAVHSLAVSEDRNWLAVAGSHAVQLIDLQSAQKAIAAHFGPITSE